MSEQFQPDRFDARLPDLSRRHPPLPPWLERRLLRRGEHVTWVRGPRFNPSWERYVTHPALFLLALLLGAACVAAGRLSVQTWGDLSPAAVFAAGGIVIASVFVLGIFSGYFTRLVVTNYRLVIMQGYEVCRSWGVDVLPRSLIAYGRRGDEESRTVDLDALQTMLGGSSDQFV